MITKEASKKCLNKKKVWVGLVQISDIGNFMKYKTKITHE